MTTTGRFLIEAARQAFEADQQLCRAIQTSYAAGELSAADLAELDGVLAPRMGLVIAERMICAKPARSKPVLRLVGGTQA